MTLDADAPARLFVALWPNERQREALAASAAKWAWNPGAAPVSPERLHLTLHFIGDVARELLPKIRAALAVPFTSFSLTLSRAALWPDGTAVLEPEDMPPALAELHAALAVVLSRMALPVDTRPYRPHVTLARRAAGASPPTPCAPMGWWLDGYALIESRQPKLYSLLERYPSPLEPSQRRDGAAGVE